MKIMLAVSALLLASAARAALPCQLTPQDYSAIAESQSKLNQGTIETLPAEKQKLLCDTRAFVGKVSKSRGAIDKIDTYSPYYLSPAERDTVNFAVDALLEQRFRKKGIAIA